MYNGLFKVVIIGNRGVGISTLLKDYASGFFTVDHLNTIGVDFHIKDLKYNGKTYKLQLWRISDKVSSSRRAMYFRNSHAAIIVYDLTDLGSLKFVPDWIEAILENNQAKLINERNQLNMINIPIMLLGNKVDLINSRKIFKSDIDHLFDKFSLSLSYEISAKKGINIDLAFNKLLERMVEIWIEHL